MKHRRRHRNGYKGSFPCGCPACGRRFASYHSFSVHETGAQQKTRKVAAFNRNVSVPLKCSHEFCRKEFENLKRLVSHLRIHLQDGVDVKCPFETCTKTFKVKSSFTSHLSRYHKQRDITQLSAAYLQEAKASRNSKVHNHVNSVSLRIKQAVFVTLPLRQMYVNHLCSDWLPCIVPRL